LIWLIFGGNNLAMKHGLGLGWEFAWSVIVSGVQGLKGCRAWMGSVLIISGVAFGVIRQGGGFD